MATSILHGFSPPLIYVISPKGEVIRKLKVDPKNPELFASSIKFYAGRLAIGFHWLNHVPQSLIKIIDLQGNSIANYKVDEGLKDSNPILACYTQKGLL